MRDASTDLQRRRGLCPGDPCLPPLSSGCVVQFPGPCTPSAHKIRSKQSGCWSGALNAVDCRHASYKVEEP